MLLLSLLLSLSTPASLYVSIPLSSHYFTTSYSCCFFLTLNIPMSFSLLLPLSFSFSILFLSLSSLLMSACSRNNYEYLCALKVVFSKQRMLIKMCSVMFSLHQRYVSMLNTTKEISTGYNGSSKWMTIKICKYQKVVFNINKNRRPHGCSRQQNVRLKLKCHFYLYF